MKISTPFLALLAVAVMAPPAMAQSRGDNWGYNRTDSDTASSQRMHKRMHHDRAMSRNDTYHDGIWREGDSENASAERHAKNKKRGKNSGRGSKNSAAPQMRSLNE